MQYKCIDATFLMIFYHLCMITEWEKCPAYNEILIFFIFYLDAIECHAIIPTLVANIFRNMNDRLQLCFATILRTYCNNTCILFDHTCFIFLKQHERFILANKLQGRSGSFFNITSTRNFCKHSMKIQ